MAKVTSQKIANRVLTIRPVINAANPVTLQEVVRTRRIVPATRATIANGRVTFPGIALKTQKSAIYATNLAILREIVKRTTTESSI